LAKRHRKLRLFTSQDHTLVAIAPLNDAARDQDGFAGLLTLEYSSAQIHKYIMSMYAHDMMR
jgi:hypothetical protein